MNQRNNRPSGFSVADRSRGSFGAYGPRSTTFYQEPPPVERKINKEDVIVFDGLQYDASVLKRLSGTFPKIGASQQPEVTKIKIESNIPRYKVTEPPARGFHNLVMVDIHLRPILVPDNYDGKPLTVVALVSKHNLKRALV